MLLHLGAIDDIGHRTLDVLLDESAESGVIERGKADAGVVPVGLAVRDNLRTNAGHTQRRKIRFRTSENYNPQTKLLSLLTGWSSNNWNESGQSNPEPNYQRGHWSYRV